MTSPTPTEPPSRYKRGTRAVMTPVMLVAVAFVFLRISYDAFHEAASQPVQKAEGTTAGLMTGFDEKSQGELKGLLPPRYLKLSGSDLTFRLPLWVLYGLKEDVLKEAVNIEILYHDAPQEKRVPPYRNAVGITLDGKAYLTPPGYSILAVVEGLLWLLAGIGLPLMALLPLWLKKRRQPQK